MTMDAADRVQRANRDVGSEPPRCWSAAVFAGGGGRAGSVMRGLPTSGARPQRVGVATHLASPPTKQTTLSEV